jgi:peptidoglycan/LPS O-acetylase OafA/YrhL
MNVAARPTGSPGASVLGYKPALDGLRALAVGVVMLAHANAEKLRGGVIGVDIFFVLSGFLITTIVVEERSNIGAFRFGRFYLRRILRLWPALFAMLGVVALYAVLQAPDQYRTATLQSAASSALYVANLPPPLAASSIFLAHTWSLALEEQFYLVWPPLLILAWGRVPARRITRVLIALIVLIIVLRQFSTFFLVAQRPDALLLGCCLALVRIARPARLDAARHAIVGWIGLGGILLFVGGVKRLVSPDFLRHGGYFLVALSAAALISHLIVGQSWLKRIFELTPLVAMGRISYALYLWHVPSFKWFFVETNFPGPVNFVLKVTTTFAFAIASYYLVEGPARRLKNRLEPKLPGRQAML